MASIQLLGLDEVQKALRSLGRERLNIAIAAGINRTAIQVDRDLKTSMARSLDRPTPFTLNSTRIAKADRNRFSAKIFVMDKQARYLRFTVDGGRIDTLTPIGAATNQYGNLPGKKADKKTLSRIARSLQRGRRGPNGLPKDMFIGEINGTYGLWQRFDRSKSRAGRWSARPPRLLVKVDKNTHRAPRWPFFEVAKRTTEKRLANDIREAIAREIKAL